MEKPVEWMHGSVREELRRWPAIARRTVGRQLNKVQKGEAPNHFREMPSIGLGVKEIKAVSDGDQYRLIYVAKFAEAVYVLHAITRKKTEKTRKKDLDMAKSRYRVLIERRREAKS
ncbi:MAG: type II toxin-antitoxin system RelE/ParE family toxin [Candidatus Obscuribacterales bacterium]|nr:type II toxin-antitoxin system RelE/ParE family toxin [Candidatus Obscuribacterales bacterium]